MQKRCSYHPPLLASPQLSPMGCPRTHRPHHTSSTSTTSHHPSMHPLTHPPTRLSPFRFHTQSLRPISTIVHPQAQSPTHPLLPPPLLLCLLRLLRLLLLHCIIALNRNSAAPPANNR